MSTAGKRKVSLSETLTTGRKLPSRIVLHGVEGIGKCLGKGTPVLMFDGSIKPVEEVRDGDQLMGPDSKPRTVSGACRGCGPLYRVTPTKGDSYVVNENHVLSLRMSRRTGGAFHRIVNVSVSEWLSWTRASKRDALSWRTGVEWGEKELPLDPYLLGCWLGDGTATKPDITTPEPEVVAAMSSYADEYGMKLAERAEAGTAKTIAISAGRSGGVLKNQFTDTLKRLGVFGNKHIPLTYRTGSREQRLELLAGLLDSDGHFLEKQNCFECTFKRWELADGLAFIARSLGFAAYVNATEKSCIYNDQARAGVYYRVHISGELAAIPNRVPRKQGRPRTQRKSVLVSGIRIEQIDDGEFFGFELDGDHLFLLGDFTVTHNTSFAAFAPSPYFLLSGGETGLETLIDAGQLSDVSHYPELTAFDDVFGVLDALISEGQKFKTVVLDTLNGFERLCHEMVCERDFGGDWGKNGFTSYMTGYDVSLAPWRELLQRLDKVRESGKSIICLCHTKVAPFRNPEGADYDRFQPDMHHKTWALTHKWADAVLFANYYTVTEEKKGQRVKGKGGTERLIHVERTAAYDAKNRFGMTDAIDMGTSGKEAWDNFLTAMKNGKAKQ